MPRRAKAYLIEKSKVDLLEIPTEMTRQSLQEERYIARISPYKAQKLPDSLPTSASSRNTGVLHHAEVTMSSLSEANTKFTLDLYQQLRKSKENIFFSPESIMSALAMLYLGARGNTAQEIEKVLHFNEIRKDSTQRSKPYQAENSGNVHQLFQKLLTELNTHSDAYELKIVNGVYGEKSFQFLPEYVNNVKKFYLADVEYLDFINAAEESRKKINSWVETHTNKKIKDLFPNKSLDRDTVLVLVNAVYFKGLWNLKFNKEETREEKFWLNKDMSKSVQMMKQNKSFNFAILEDVKARILEIPYEDEELSMIVLLPDEVDGLQKLEDKLTAEKLKEWMSPQNMNKTTLNLYFPRFKVENSYDLKTTLADMGMGDVFSPQDADLSGMSGRQKLAVSKAVHKSFVEVNEEGTEAAAATGIGVALTSSPMVENFYCNHPFLFFIKQNKTDSILFFGRVSSP